MKLKTKPHSKRLILFLALGILALIGCITTTTILLLSRIDYVISSNPTYEVKTEVTISSLFSEIKFGTVDDPDGQLDTDAIGEKNQEVTFTSQLGTKKTINVIYDVVDTIAPLIKGENELSFKTTDSVDLLSNFSAEDNSGQPVTLSIDGEYDLAKAGEYHITIIAKDESGNESEKPVSLKISEPPRPIATTKRSMPYYVEVNRRQNVVIVYSKDQAGNYTNIAKVFVASTGAPGSETPLGTFTAKDRYETLRLVGNVWGHYTLRINGSIFFHSVPYFTKGAPWNNLEYEEYNKLGDKASAGCVRLAAIDAKWIYDNIGYGTTIKIYDSDTLPAGVTKPSAIKIDISSPNRGWDPTDPDPSNPWRQ